MQNQSENRKRTAVYSIAHFLMDMFCAFLVFRFLKGSSVWMECLLIYNFFAFAVQMPLGLVADKFGKNRKIAAGGFLLLALCYFVVTLTCGIQNGSLLSDTVNALKGAALQGDVIPKGAAVLVAAVTGLGNAMFHVGGGLEVLNGSDTGSMASCGSLGIFVSPGALGLYIGTLMANTRGLMIPLLAGLFILFTGIILLLLPIKDTVNAEFTIKFRPYIQENLMNQQKNKQMCNRDKRMNDQWNNQQDKRMNDQRNSQTGGITLALLCLFLVVCLRSYLGLTMQFQWKAEYGFISVLAVVLGKTAGGFASDLFGAGKTAVVSLGAAAVCFLFGNIPLIGILAVFLFQMTMPITLKAASVYLNGAKGFAFGLLTFALFVGFLIPYLDIKPLFSGGVRYAVIAAVSLPLLVLGLWKIKKKGDIMK